MTHLQANQHNLTLGTVDSNIISVDVFFDNYRVWSIDLRHHKSAQPLTWPHSLKRYLRGSTLITLRNSATDELITSAEVTFSPAPERTQVADEAGVALSVNKWGRLGHSLNAIGEGVDELILDRAEEVIDQLIEMGLRPFVVGGTLLGAVRAGKLLSHDDDADIAYLSEHTNPIDVAVEGLRVARQLEELGYEVMRHSAAHMQLHFRNDHDNAEYYIDVFAAFFTSDGYINQPFHVRGEMTEDQMLPFSTVTISGREFSVPADTDHWLTVNYDKDWRTPIPGYTLDTRYSTVRRFENWFGSFNFGRHFWNDFYADTESDKNKWAAGAAWILKHQGMLSSSSLIDIGSGSGQLATQLAGPRTVIATDYARVPLNLLAEKGVRAEHLNVARLEVLAAPIRFGINGSFDVTANHVLDQLPHKTREGVLRLIHLALASGGSALATLYGRPTADVTFEDPTGWHLSRHDLAVEAQSFGMSVHFFKITAGSPASLSRDPYAARFFISTEPFELPPQEVSVKQRLGRALRSLRPGSMHTEVAELTERVNELQLELDEYREHSIRVAQLLDLAEQRFTPTDTEAFEPPKD